MATASPESPCPTSSSNKRKRSPSPVGESCPSSPDETSGSPAGSCSNSTGLAADAALKASNDFARRSILGPSRKKKKCVSFDGVTVFYFRRSQGFTSVPSQGGSTLGMLPKHELKKSFSLCDYSKEQERLHRVILKRQLIEKRQQQFLENGAAELAEEISEEEIEDELSSINVSDYYFLQPIPTKQRRALLRIAGVKKVDNVEKVDLKKIRVSRESCGCDCRNVCNPATCACAQAGIKCQVDRLSFPCGCTKEGCGNSEGRVEFNPVRVRTHFLHTIMRLDADRDSNGGEGPSSSDGGEEAPNGMLRTSEEYTMLASCTKPCCDNSTTVGDNSATGYTNSLNQYNNGQMACATIVEGHHLFPNQYGGRGVEGNIPVEVKQHLNVQDLIPRMLHYNDSDETLLNHHHHVGLGCTNDPVPSLATYPHSDDSILTSSSDASSNDSYHYNQCNEFAFKESPTYAEISKASDMCVSSAADTSFTEVPTNKLSTLDESSDLHLGLPLCSSSTFTDLNAHITTFSGNFGNNVVRQPAPSITSSPGSYDNGMIMDSSVSQTEPCHFDKGAVSSTSLDSTPCTTTSSYTILSALNAIDPLDETELATSKISTVAVSMGDTFNHATVNHSEFHELQNCSSAEAVVSGMVRVNCPDVKLTPNDTNGEEQPIHCFDSVNKMEDQNKDEMVHSAQLI
ncbi:uncharacterized protein LOC119722665 [Patiria miniata]|uniref:Cysteine/serine-rich nuclear protein N-terminal domain-containing protein n=1 Tax=Patiria miniata TaxID=46514 RepID=A0A913ZAP5_PATMI|nr:uncharacterized protein LOC119722665 [Patiria miniata]